MESVNHKDLKTKFTSVPAQTFWDSYDKHNAKYPSDFRISYVRTGIQVYWIENKLFHKLFDN